MTTTLISEPEILASAKEKLFLDLSEEVGYSVTDTQFSTTEWQEGISIKEETKSTLSPFNHVKIAGGYPDLVAAAWLKDNHFRGENIETEIPPLVVIEAKGHTSSGKVDAELGVIQAHNRLSEANLAFSAIPSQAYTDHIQSLGRELNVGIICVSPDGDAILHEKPRLVGGHVSEEASIIRVQAGPQSVADKSFNLNRPKNYLGYPICVYAAAKRDQTTKKILSAYVVNDFNSARKGAIFLGLVNQKQEGRDSLTALGEEVVRFGLSRHNGSLESLLKEFEGWKNSRRRLTQLAPAWALISRFIAFSYPATRLLTRSIQALHARGDEPTLPELVLEAHKENPTFAIEFFIRDTDAARTKALNAEGELDESALIDTDVYRSVTTYHFKQILYHSGILNDSGSDTSNLVPEESIWALEQPL